MRQLMTDDNGQMRTRGHQRHVWIVNVSPARIGVCALAQLCVVARALPERRPTDVARRCTRAPVQHAMADESRRQAWIAHYVSNGQYAEAQQIGWDGAVPAAPLPAAPSGVTAPPQPAATSRPNVSLHQFLSAEVLNLQASVLQNVHQHFLPTAHPAPMHSESMRFCMRRDWRLPSKAIAYYCFEIGLLYWKPFPQAQ